MPAGAHLHTSESYMKKINAIVPESDAKLFKAAFYNVALFVFLALCCAGLTAVYFLLQACVKPILWAALCGTVLFPLKRHVTSIARQWLHSLKVGNTPLVVGVAYLPLQLMDSVADALWAIVSTKWAAILVAYPAFVLFGRFRLFHRLLVMATKVFIHSDTLITIFSAIWAYPVLLVYVAIYASWLWAQGPDGASSMLAKALSIPPWFLMSCIAASCFGPLKVLVFVAMVSLVLLSAVGIIGSGRRSIDETQSSSTRAESAESMPSPSTLTAQSPSSASSSSDGTSSLGNAGHHVHSSSGTHYSKGDVYLSWLLVACGLLWFGTHIWLLNVLFAPLVYMIVKQLGEYFGIWAKIGEGLKASFVYVREKSTYALHAAVPSSVRHLFRMLFTGDQKLIEGLEGSVDLLSSIIVMLIVLVSVAVFSVFMVVQLHNESLHLVKLSGNLVNTTLAADSEMSQWAGNLTDQALSGRNVSQVMKEAYEYGRTWLVQQARGLMSPDADPKRVDMIEAQIKTLVDRVYDMWLAHEQGFTKDNQRRTSVADAWNHLLVSFDLSALSSELSAIVQENVGTLKSIAESGWKIIQSNLSMLFSVLFSFIGIVLSFGFEILNIVISTVIFFTVLYYLLASSGEQWKPLEWLSMVAPAASGGGPSPLTIAFEQAISGVFVLSAKMAAFYGLYVWFVHTLFAVNVVFVPSALAALLAAVPFLGAYWVCAFGAVELWLVRGEPAVAGLFVIAHFLPMCFVDGAFYAEVRGSHPYVTGLAIVGGVYWLGLEGAFIGPILLCSVLVLVNIYRIMLLQQSVGLAAVRKEE